MSAAQQLEKHHLQGTSWIARYAWCWKAWKGGLSPITLNCQWRQSAEKLTKVASTPPMTGMAMSMRTQWNWLFALLLPSMASMASRPLLASSTAMPREVSIICATFWLIRLSSAKRTLRPWQAKHMLKGSNCGGGCSLVLEASDVLRWSP